MKRILLVAALLAAACHGRPPTTGDIIVQFGPFPVNNLKDLSTRLAQLPDSGRVRIAVIRDKQLGVGILHF